MRERDPFSSALEWVREKVRDGRLGPGQPLITTDLAAALRMSVTPVREALSRLAGEGLIEERRGRGFFTLRLGAAEIEGLYRLHGAYAEIAHQMRLERNGGIEIIKPPSPPVSEDASSFRTRTERFWIGLVRGSDSELLERGHRHLTDQLARVRLIEPAVLTDTSTELSELAALSYGLGDQAFVAAIATYHQRRQQKSRALSAALRDSETTRS